VDAHTERVGVVPSEAPVCHAAHTEVGFAHVIGINPAHGTNTLVALLNCGADKLRVVAVKAFAGAPRLPILRNRTTAPAAKILAVGILFKRWKSRVAHVSKFNCGSPFCCLGATVGVIASPNTNRAALVTALFSRGTMVIWQPGLSAGGFS
jgi:hypothetical protein